MESIKPKEVKKEKKEPQKFINILNNSNRIYIINGKTLIPTKETKLTLKEWDKLRGSKGLRKVK
jgi:hypothetical protein